MEIEMPYKLRKAPNRDLYWVVNKDTGEKHSKEPIPLERAKAQMRALYAAEKKGGAKQYIAPPIGAKGISKERYAKINQNVADFFAPIEKIKYAKEHPKSILLPAEKKARKMQMMMLRSAGIDPSTVADEAKGEKAEVTPPADQIPSLIGDNKTAPDELKVVGYGNQKWVQKVVKDMRKGAFTKQAHRAKMSPIDFAEEVMKNKDKYTMTTQRRAQFLLNVQKHRLNGGGFFGDIWNAAKAAVRATKSAVTNVIGRVRDVSRGIRYDYSPSVRDLLAKIGDRPIIQAYVRRDPIVSLLNTALNFISRGKWNEVRAKYNYDKLFHLGLEVVIKMNDDMDVLGRYVIEKNEVISISLAKGFKPDTEIMEVPLSSGGTTINKLLEGAKAVMGDKFFPYDPFYNNCQDFIMAILNGSGLSTPSIAQFVKQPIEEVVKELPGYTGKIAKTITDLGGLANVALEGRGGWKPRAKFAMQFRKMGVSPSEYILEARRKAKKLGLAYKHLGFSDDDKHKLMIPNADGSIVRFGAVGLGDHILYTLAKDSEADLHRKHYLQRATKIKGDWKKDQYSPNSLAIGILW